MDVCYLFFSQGLKNILIFYHEGHEVHEEIIGQVV